MIGAELFDEMRLWGLKIVAESDSEGHEVGVAWDEGRRYVELGAEGILILQLASIPEELTLPLVRGATLEVLRVDVPREAVPVASVDPCWSDTTVEAMPPDAEDTST